MSNDKQKQRQQQNFPQRSGASGGTAGRGASGFTDDVTDQTTNATLSAPEPEAKPFVPQNIPPPPPPPKNGLVELPNASMRTDVGPAAVLATEVKAPPVEPPAPQLAPAPPPKPKTKLQQLVEAMDKNEKRANVNLEGTDSRTLPGRAVAKREAQEALVEQRKLYDSKIKEGLCAMFLSGSRDDQLAFVRVAGEEAPVPFISVGADELYRAIAQEVESSMRTDRMFEPSQFMRMNAAITELCNSLSLGSTPDTFFRAGALLQNHDAVIAHVRKIVRDGCGDSLNNHYMLRLISDRAWKIRYQDDVVPVIVTGATPAEVKGLAKLFNSKSIDVAVSDTSASAIKKAFAALRNKLRN